MIGVMYWLSASVIRNNVISNQIATQSFIMKKKKERWLEKRRGNENGVLLSKKVDWWLLLAFAMK